MAHRTVTRDGLVWVCPLDLVDPNPVRDRMENPRVGGGSSQDEENEEMVKETPPTISKQVDVAMTESPIDKGDVDQVDVTPPHGCQ